jgi:flagellar biosynthesis protein FliP
MKNLITLTIALLLTFFISQAKSGEEYNKAVLGHVIQSQVNGNNVDMQKLMEQEMQKLAHQFVLQSVSIMQQYLPTILDNAMTEMRLKADREYKCQLLKGSNIEDDCNE